MCEFFARRCTSIPASSVPLRMIRGESYVGLTSAILRISARTSLATARCPGFPLGSVVPMIPEPRALPGKDWGGVGQ